jgi:hypothetical protein
MTDYFKVSWVHSGGPMIEEVDYPPPTAQFKYRFNQDTSNRRAELTEQLQQFFKTRGLPLMGRILYVSRRDDSPLLEWTDSVFPRP